MVFITSSFNAVSFLQQYWSYYYTKILNKFGAAFPPDGDYTIECSGGYSRPQRDRKENSSNKLIDSLRIGLRNEHNQLRIKKRPPEIFRRPPCHSTRSRSLHRVDAPRKSGQFTPGGIAVERAFLRAAMQCRHRFLERGLGGCLVATGDGFLDLTQSATHAATACAVALAPSFGLADSFLRGSAVSHFKFRSSYVPSGAGYRAVQPCRQARTAGFTGNRARYESA